MPKFKTMKWKLAWAAFALLASSSMTLAEGLYFGVQGSIPLSDQLINQNTVTDTPNPGDSVSVVGNSNFEFGGVAGYKFNDWFRAEIEADYFSFSGNATCVSTVKCLGTNFDGSAFSVLGNAWLDLPEMGPVTPYLGGGIGVGDISASSPSDASGWGLAYQVGAGVRAKVSDNLVVDLGYRFRGGDIPGNVSNALTGNSGAATSYGSHLIQVGLQFQF